MIKTSQVNTIQSVYLNKNEASPELLFQPSRIKIFLFENISDNIKNYFKQQDYQVEYYSDSIKENEFLEKIKLVHIVGVESIELLSKIKVKETKNLLGIGCYFIDKVDDRFIKTAKKQGVMLFQSNENDVRSVAEFLIGEIIMLGRQIRDRNIEMHKGIWNKTSYNSFEIRGKTLGIIGYGPVGVELSILAEAIGMKVIFYDERPKLGIGKSMQVFDLNRVLSIADYITLHETQTIRVQPNQIKKGAYVLASSEFIDINLYLKSLESKHLSGVAIDIISTQQLNQYQHLSNLILTPNISNRTNQVKERNNLFISKSIIHFIKSNSFLF